MENKMPDGSEDHIIIVIIGTIIGLLILKREVTCLLSGPRFDEGDGKFTSDLLRVMGDGSCVLNGKSGRIMGKRTKIG